MIERRPRRDQSLNDLCVTEMCGSYKRSAIIRASYQAGVVPKLDCERHQIGIIRN